MSMLMHVQCCQNMYNPSPLIQSTLNPSTSTACFRVWHLLVPSSTHCELSMLVPSSLTPRFIAFLQRTRSDIPQAILWDWTGCGSRNCLLDSWSNKCQARAGLTTPRAVPPPRPTTPKNNAPFGGRLLWHSLSANIFHKSSRRKPHSRFSTRSASCISWCLLAGIIGSGLCDPSCEAMGLFGPALYRMASHRVQHVSVAHRCL